MVDSSVQTDKNLSAAQDRLSSFQAMALVLGRYGALIALACLVFYFSLASPYFLTVGNLLQILNQASLGTIVAGGLTVVLAGGHSQRLFAHTHQRQGDSPR